MYKILGMKKIKSNKTQRELILLKVLGDNPKNTLTASNIFDSALFSEVGDMTDNIFIDVENVKNGVIALTGDLVPGSIIDLKYAPMNGRVSLTEIIVSK